MAPFISVVTPFYNVAPYLEHCIQSVLGQTFTDFEYLLVDNKSSDGSRGIAEKYAAIDPRIRLVENDAFVGQVENYNGALVRIHAESRYVKLVQADDAIFPDALSRMVEVGERDERVGIVSSYYLKGDKVRGNGVPYGVWRQSGRDVCRNLLCAEDAFVLGSPTTVMYRASIVRARQPFYALGRYHEDSEAGVEILLEHDLGFVHQVLSFLRTDNISIMSAARRFNPEPLDHLILLEKYGRMILSEEEFLRRSELEWRAYRGFLGKSLLEGRGREFWDYHTKGLATIGRRLERHDLLRPAAKQFLRLALDPVGMAEGRWRELWTRRGN